MKTQQLIASFCLAMLPVFFVANSAEAVTCAKGVYRAGCAGPNGAVAVGPHGAAAVRKPVPVTTCRMVNGVRVCR